MKITFALLALSLLASCNKTEVVYVGIPVIVTQQEETESVRAVTTAATIKVNVTPVKGKKGEFKITNTLVPGKVDFVEN